MQLSDWICGNYVQGLPVSHLTSDKELIIGEGVEFGDVEIDHIWKLIEFKHLVSRFVVLVVFDFHGLRALFLFRGGLVGRWQFFAV